MQKYYLGLDVGTNSVGYAVTDYNYNLLKHRGEPMWGTHVFEEGKQCADRRGFRTSRRRLDRRQQRVHLLQEIFAEEISKIDSGFYKRIQASALNRDDTDYKYTLFEDESFSDKDFHEKYPTIHHLITDLMESNKPHDIRLVYIACAWLVAHRGHFLSEVNKDSVSDVLDFDNIYESFVAFCQDEGLEVPWNENEQAKNIIRNIMLEKVGVSSKTSMFKEQLFAGKFPKDDTDEISVDLIFKLLAGGTVDSLKLFPNNETEENAKICFRKSEEEFVSALDLVGNYADFLIKLRGLYDWSLLYEASGGSTSISKAKVKVYEQHKKDLAFFKHFIKKYIPSKYKEVFVESKDKLNNYVAYSYNFNSVSFNKRLSKKATPEDFCNYIKSIIKDIPADTIAEVDKCRYDDMILRLEMCSFMPKQVVGENRVIPYQLYYHELKTILDNAFAYFPFIGAKDADGYVTKDKILSIMEYRIPYYVGPLHKDDNSKFAWIVKKGKGRIYPWNFDIMVDLDASEQAFMDKLTNTCTYIPGESVLPKNSLLYSKFTVLNEINNLRINDIPISVECKQAIYNNLFSKYETVRLSKIKEYLLANNYITKDDTLSGVDISIKSSLKSYNKLKHLIENGNISYDDAESIITYISYSDDKARLKKRIKNEFPQLSEDDIKYIVKLKFSDFGRLSKKFLSGISTVDKKTGEIMTIIQVMWEYNLNLMEVINSDQFEFKEELQKTSDEYFAVNDSTIESMLNNMYVPNAVRRSIYRTIDIVKDVVNVNGCAPNKIFIEMARGGGEKNKRTKTRRANIEEKYAEYKKYYPNEIKILSELLASKTDNALQDEKLYLYFMQLGRCMYSGDPIDIERIDTKLYDIDHIIPQSRLKDDSIRNKVLVKSELNGAKGDKYPLNFALNGVQDRMRTVWKSYYERGLITEEKYKRLVRTIPFTDEELMGFINRQLVETRQSTKAIANVFKSIYPDCEIVYVKAGLVSDFRQEFDIIKCRAVNDLHHAKDAYLNIVCGNVYHTRFTKKFYLDQPYSLKTTTLFTHSVYDEGVPVWNGSEDISRIKKIVLKNNIHCTRYAFVRKGGLFNQNPEKAKVGLIQRKSGLDTEKYGGYNNSTASCFMMAKYTDVSKKKAITDIMFVPIEEMFLNKVLANESFALQYIKECIAKIEGRNIKDITDVSLPFGIKPIKINTVMIIDGYRLSLAAKSNGGKVIIWRSMEPLLVSLEQTNYIRSLIKHVEKVKKNKNIEFDYEHDGIDTETNCAIYDTFITKISETKFNKVLGGQENTIIEGKTIFTNSNLSLQVETLLSVMSLFEMGRITGCNLKNLGGSGQAGVISTSSKMSNIIRGCEDVRFCFESASGIYSTVSENLVNLL